MTKNHVTFKDVPCDCVFFAYHNPNKPLECDTITGYKDKEGKSILKGFNSNYQLHPDEPVIYYS
jgi:hypothetical protein